MEKVKLFYQWYINWYKTILDEMTIIISLPNELQPFKEDNVVVVELFRANNDFVLVEPHLKKMLEKADELGVIIYIDPEPRYNTKNTKEFFIHWYKQFGFVLTENKFFMKRFNK